MNAEKLKQWIWESLLLDLAYDEEDEALANEAANVGPLSLDKMIERFGQPPTISEFLHEGSIPENLRTPDNPETYFWYFKALKWFRVKTSLESNKMARSYAEERSKKRYGELRKASKKRDECLQGVALHCMGAMSSVKAKSHQGGEWRTLLGLFHSEACAGARQEISYGLAASYSDLNLDGNVGSTILGWIAGHNVARGLNHLNNQLDASKMLDHKVDSFLEQKNIKKLLTDLPSKKKSSERKAMLYRLLYFPAVLTLAQALEDLGRHTERRFYLRAGMDKAKASEVRSPYWTKYFRTKLSFSSVDTRRSPANPCSPDPKEPDILKPKETELQYQMCCGCKKVECPSWIKSIIWLLCWHACDTHQLYERIRRTCEECDQILKALEDKPWSEWTPEDNDKIDSIFDAFKEHFRLLKVWVKNESNGLDHLLGKGDGASVYLHLIWPPAKALYQALKDLRKYRQDDGLQEWFANLRKFLEPEKTFSPYRSRNEWFETIRPTPGKNPTCPATPGGKVKVGLAQRKNAKACGSHGCTYRLLHLQDETPRKNNGDLGSLDYFFSVMAAQQERFKLYLGPRTGKMKYFRPGEAYIPAPDFELIALRRWNSFSPNLGSRGSVTVGGGYLIRMYDPSAGRYLGVAVDPGYNFLENLFNEGFTIPDIDLVVVTHAHPDHTENLTNLITLLRERSKRLKGSGGYDQKSVVEPKDCSILLVLTEGVFERFQSHFKSDVDYIRDIAVLHAKECRGNAAGENTLWLWIDNNGTGLCHMDLSKAPPADVKHRQAIMKIEAKQALHGDGTKHDSIGVVVTLEKKGQEPIRLGILSDSRYHGQLSSDYADCQVLIAHMGSLLDEAWYKDYNRDPLLQKDIRNYLDASPNNRKDPKAYSRERLYSLLTKKNHLYLPGLARFVCELGKPNRRRLERLILLSEFGEELRGGLRTSVTSRLSKINGNRAMHFMPVDVGLRVDISNRKVFCSVCHRFLEPKEIVAYSVLPSEEAMAYICLDCKRSRSGEIDRLVEEWCHTGRPVVRLREPVKGSDPA